MAEPARASGAVLTGGRSRRMGADKALVAVDGVAMARRVTDAMRAAGLERVVAIGGDATGLGALGIEVVEDRHPGEGPLGGIVTALAASPTPWVVVTACDMPWVEPTHVRALLDAIDDDVEVVVSAAAGHLQPLHAAWRTTALPAIEASFAAGERSPRRSIPARRHRVVELGTGPWSTDVDEPLD